MNFLKRRFSAAAEGTAALFFIQIFALVLLIPFLRKLITDKAEVPPAEEVPTAVGPAVAAS